MTNVNTWYANGIEHHLLLTVTSPGVATRKRSPRMITKEHEAPLDLLKQNVSLLPLVLKAHGFELPSDFDACEPATERFTELGPHELNADGASYCVTTGRRGLDVSAEVRERIDGCRDTSQLELWLTRAATVATADKLFD